LIRGAHVNYLSQDILAADDTLEVGFVVPAGIDLGKTTVVGTRTCSAFAEVDFAADFSVLLSQLMCMHLSSISRLCACGHLLLLPKMLQMRVLPPV
jgi:hypothetical protein